MTRELWTIVLAGGRGQRLSATTDGVPKQFWRPGPHAASLLEQTLLRLESFASPDRTFTVVGEAHRSHVHDVRLPRAMGRVMYQPMDRGTAAGVLLPLAHLWLEDPGALLILTPADHGIEDECAFRASLNEAADHLHARRADIVLFGAEPTSPAEDYGWIQISNATPRGSLRDVAGFVEKPASQHARRLFRSTAVWSTMVVMARAGALMSIFRRHLPLHTDILTAAAVMKPRMRDQFLRAEYSRLAQADFSRDVLTPARPLSVYTWAREIGWSDLGTPDRLARWLAPKADSFATAAAGAA